MSGVESLIESVHSSLWAEVATSVDDDDNTGDLEPRIRQLLGAIEPLASTTVVERVVAEVEARIDGLGPLHELGADPAVSEIMINGDGWVWVERAGQLHRSERRLEPSVTMHLVRRLAGRAGRTIDLRHPSVDVRLPDGSRLHAIIPPLAVDGPCVTIRRFSPRAIGLQQLASPAASTVLRKAVDTGQTVIVAGATSSGKTTLLNALASLLHDDTRIVTIEDAAELRLLGRHVLRLETRRETETTPAVTLRELARDALRMRPDRIICGEMRGAEALDLVQAMNTGHDGSMSTVHANSPADALRRIETMMLLGDADLPLRAIREQLASCIDLIVMTARQGNGVRAVSAIATVSADDLGEWTTELVYRRDQSAVQS